MKYEYTEKAFESLSNFSIETREKIRDKIEEASAEEFFNHESYSYVYDHHGNPWDKLDFKEGELNYRVFFAKIESKVYILDIFHREELDYEEEELYNLLDRIAEGKQG
ncbi:MAG: hypothetical protein ABEJ56_03900 [Candidatus Nanohaloarchaea archaeon]